MANGRQVLFKQREPSKGTGAQLGNIDSRIKPICCQLKNTLPALAVPLPPTSHLPRIALPSDQMKTAEAWQYCVNRESAVS
ncbi:hypothetical protein J6590_101089, partial [Homalodisca vitripennis]